MKDPLYAVSMHRGNERALCVIDRPCPRKCYVRLKYADELLQNDMDTIINLDNKPEVLADA